MLSLDKVQPWLLTGQAVEAESYWPNDYGLYNMAGNVSEWTDSSYDKGAYNFDMGLNPNVSDSTNLRKVIRGGSWKDIAYFKRLNTWRSKFLTKRVALLTAI